MHEQSVVVRVGAIDDHPVMLAGIEALLADRVDDMDFVGTGRTVSEFLELGRATDVVLLDLRLGDQSRPAENVRDLVDAGVRVLVYTQGGMPAAGREAIAAGALGVVLKRDPFDVLVEAIRSASRGEGAATRELAQLLDGEPRLVPSLSDREREALRLYASNMPAKSVARRMGVAEGTVKEYLKRIRAKYEALDRRARTKLDLYHRAREDGLLGGDVVDDAGDGASPPTPGT